MESHAAPVGGPVCACCTEPAVIYQPVNKRHLCGTHIVCDVEARVASTIREAGQIRAGDRIAVGLSGGKDSTALLVILSRLLPSWPGAGLVAITVDEGIAGYRAETIRAAETLTGRLGVEHRIVSFCDLIGDDLDTLLAGREAQACTICGILRKKALTDAARAAGATAIATGHNLDDEAQSVLMNALRGDLPRLIRNTGTAGRPRSCRGSNPLQQSRRRRLRSTSSCRASSPCCPSARTQIMHCGQGSAPCSPDLKTSIPGRCSTSSGAKRPSNGTCAGTPVMGHLHRCRECGDPCSGDLCQVCRLRHSLGK